MTKRFVLIVAAAWVVCAAAAVANGILREATLEPRLGSPWAGAASVALLVGFVLLVAGLLARGPWAKASPRALWGAGFAWLGLTVAFEFLFGHYVMGASWAELLAAYDVRSGSLWVLVPATMLLAPRLARGAWRPRAGRAVTGAAR